MALSSAGVSHVIKELERVIKKKVNNQPIGPFKEEWRNLPEYPSTEEILIPRGEEVSDEQWDQYKYSSCPSKQLPANKLKWASKQSYLEYQYKLLREDATAPLREAVQSFRSKTRYDNEEFYVYTKAHIIGLNLTSQAVAFRVSFLTEKAVRWHQSKRLQPGTLLAISTERDIFSTICKIAVVASRTIEGGLEMNPPQLDIFAAGDTIFDFSESYIILEARSGYFESLRHVLKGIQDVATESSPLEKHIIELDGEIEPPAYLVERPFMNLSNLAKLTDPEYSLENVNVLEDFPNIPNSVMDASQSQACKRMLTQSLAIIQGPPGTGKTYTSVSALHCLISNNNNGPPIIVSAQTNHALDQILSHIMQFEQNVLRLGGRTDKKNVEIIARTLYELRRTVQDLPRSRGMKSAIRELEGQKFEVKNLLAPILADALDESCLLEYGCITQTQQDSLYEDGWVSADQSGEVSGSPIAAWLGIEGVMPVERTPMLNLGLPYEEDVEEYIQLEQQDLGDLDQTDEKEVDILSSEPVIFRRTWTGNAAVSLDMKRIKRLSKQGNLYDIPSGMRGAVYRYWEKQVDLQVLRKFQDVLENYSAIAQSLKCTKFLSDARLISHLGIKVIGCTTTGLSKYRALLSSLQPRILLIEEAAETVEGSIIAGMVPSIEQLILVGDHQQLLPQPAVATLEGLYISLFERLINGGMPYTMLNSQRRMIPAIRALLTIPSKFSKPIYPSLSDHPSVCTRPNVPGMGGRNVYFFHHSWPESRSSDMSISNLDEAELVGGFFNYLVLNKIDPSQITVLTFYNGQRKTIIAELKKIHNLAKHFFHVFTVDSYQGEENDIILLSMSRSNTRHNIGFLESQNRLVVALSRARCGLYMFGNAITLKGEERDFCLGRKPIYGPILEYLVSQGSMDIDSGLPIQCFNHGRKVIIKDAESFLNIPGGGCTQKCEAVLSCGHPCPTTCHKFDHELIVCPRPCGKQLACGHGCSEACGKVCACSQCIPIQLENIATETAQSWSLDMTKVNGEMAEELRVQLNIPRATGGNGPIIKDTYRPMTIDENGRVASGPVVHTIFSRQAEPGSSNNTAPVIKLKDMVIKSTEVVFLDLFTGANDASKLKVSEKARSKEDDELLIQF
ncbi:P-loop containing nucleoside triphosphate hydrolase protein [Bisporella sp. PMI_857]|nr:P-loop containing nucleoside triphosphate hydrolase protein [Bisporella sp. PMI_857]